VQESGFFARDEPILGLGPAPEVTNRAFEMKQGDVSGALRASRGFVFETLVARQDPYVPKLEEVKERVRDEVVKEKARAASRQKAAEIAAKLKAAPDFEKAAKAAGVSCRARRRFRISARRRRSKTPRSSCRSAPSAIPSPPTPEPRW
jgi:hypothetical protein